MSQITLDTEKIKAGLIILFAIIGVVFTVFYLIWLVTAHAAAPAQQVVIQPTAIPTPVPTPAPVPTQIYPPVITFTVLSTTVSNGHYQAYSTTGQTMYFADYATWNSLWPQNTYLGNVVGMEGPVYDIGTVTLLNGYQHTYNNQYYDKCGYWMSPNYCDGYYPYYHHPKEPAYTPGYRIIDSSTLYDK